jgi:O-antigen/teichoic acid export membrane protein
MTAPITAGMLARNAVRNLLGVGLPLLVALAALPLLVARLDTARFGVLGLVWVFFGLFTELGLGRATTRYAAASLASGSTADARAVLRLGVRLQLVLGIVSAVGLALAAAPFAARLSSDPAIADEARQVLFIVAAAVPVIMVSSAYRGLLEAAHRFDLVNRVRIPLASATYLLPVLVLIAGSSIVAVVLVLAIARAAATAVYVRYCRRVLGSGGEEVSEHVPSAWAVLRFGAWQTVGGVLAPLLVYLDRFLLGAIAGVAAVGLYTPAFEIALRLLILPTSLVMALFPAFSAWAGSRDDVRSARMAARAVLYIIIGLAPLVALLVTLGRDGMTLWLNAEFGLNTAMVLSILSFGVLLNATAFVPATLLAGAGRPDIPPKLYLLQLPFYAVLAAVLIVRWGLLGAAVAWTCRVGVDALLLFVATHRVGILRWQELWRVRVPQSLAGVVGCLLVPAILVPVVSGLWMRLALAGAAAGATAAFLWIYSLRAEGRSQIVAALRVAST